MQLLRTVGEKSHLGVTVLLALGLPLALMAAKLPLKLDWPHFLRTFWVGLIIQSAFFACLLYVAAFPLRKTIQPVWMRYRKQKLRFLILGLLYAQLYYLFGSTGLMFFSLVVIAIFEFVDRTRDHAGAFVKAISSFLIPAVYWFTGLVLVFSLNQAVIAMKPHGANDALFDRMDSWFLFGSTVSEVAHGAINVLPLSI